MDGTTMDVTRLPTPEPRREARIPAPGRSRLRRSPALDAAPLPALSPPPSPGRPDAVLTIMLFRGHPDRPGHLARPLCGPKGDAGRLALHLLRGLAPFDRLATEPGAVVAIDGKGMAAGEATLWQSRDPAAMLLSGRAVVCFHVEAERVASDPAGEWHLKVVGT